jgi:hypothetical protein
MTAPLWRNPKLYGWLGFVLVAAPSLFFFFMGMPGTSVTETEYANGNKAVVTETVWMGAFNPFLLSFVIGAAVELHGDAIGAHLRHGLEAFLCLPSLYLQCSA